MTTSRAYTWFSSIGSTATFYPRTKDFCIKSMCTNQIVSYLKPHTIGDCYFTIGPSSPSDFTTLYFISIRVFIQNSEQFQYSVQMSSTHTLTQCYTHLVFCQYAALPTPRLAIKISKTLHPFPSIVFTLKFEN